MVHDSLGAFERKLLICVDGRVKKQDGHYELDNICPVTAHKVNLKERRVLNREPMIWHLAGDEKDEEGYSVAAAVKFKPKSLCI